jgi:hypothetical protein
MEAAMDRVPTRIKREIRQLAGLAQERELTRELQGLREQFERWQRGELTPFELSDAIHRFHDGPARDLYVQYMRSHPEPLVAGAIAAGVIDRGETSPGVLDYLAPGIRFNEDERASAQE